MMIAGRFVFPGVHLRHGFISDTGSSQTRVHLRHGFISDIFQGFMPDDALKQVTCCRFPTCCRWETPGSGGLPTFTPTASLC